MPARVYGIQFPIKWCLFQPSRSKTVGEDRFLAQKKCNFSERGETHQNITILTMCKIYNVNNNKTAAI